MNHYAVGCPGCLGMLMMTHYAVGWVGCLWMLKMTVNAAGCRGYLSTYKFSDAPIELYGCTKCHVAALMSIDEFI